MTVQNNKQTVQKNTNVYFKKKFTIYDFDQITYIFFRFHLVILLRLHIVYIDFTTYLTRAKLLLF